MNSTSISTSISLLLRALVACTSACSAIAKSYLHTTASAFVCEYAHHSPALTYMYAHQNLVHCTAHFVQKMFDWHNVSSAAITPIRSRCLDMLNQAEPPTVPSAYVVSVTATSLCGIVQTTFHLGMLLQLPARYIVCRTVKRMRLVVLCYSYMLVCVALMALESRKVWWLILYHVCQRRAAKIRAMVPQWTFLQWQRRIVLSRVWWHFRHGRHYSAPSMRC